MTLDIIPMLMQVMRDGKHRERQLATALCAALADEPRNCFMLVQTPELLRLLGSALTVKVSYPCFQGRKRVAGEALAACAPNASRDLELCCCPASRQ